MDNDFEVKAQNVNLRVTPSMKTHIIKEAKKAGLSMSDFIEHCIVLSSEAEKAIETAKEYKNKAEQLDRILGRFESIYEEIEPNKKATSKDLFNGVMKMLGKLKKSYNEEI